MEDPWYAPHRVGDAEIRALTPLAALGTCRAPSWGEPLMGTRNCRRARCQVLASSEISPPLTRQ